MQPLLRVCSRTLRGASLSANYASIRHATSAAPTTKILGVPVFLPTFTMALVRPSSNLPPNVAMFRVATNVNKFEIKSYLQSIYNVDVEKVHTKIVLGKTKVDRRTRKKTKRKDYKLAYVHLMQPFQFPETMFPYHERSEDEAQRKISEHSN
eukprot:gene5181-7025_t